jgi:hypothetical protein
LALAEGRIKTDRKKQIHLWTIMVVAVPVPCLLKYKFIIFQSMIQTFTVRFYVTWSLLLRLPQSRLGKLREGRHTDAIFSICDQFNLEVKGHYFCPLFCASQNKEKIPEIR